MTVGSNTRLIPGRGRLSRQPTFIEWAAFVDVNIRTLLSQKAMSLLPYIEDGTDQVVTRELEEAVGQYGIASVRAAIDAAAAPSSTTRWSAVRQERRRHHRRQSGLLSMALAAELIIRTKIDLTLTALDGEEWYRNPSNYLPQSEATRFLQNPRSDRIIMVLSTDGSALVVPACASGAQFLSKLCFGRIKSMALHVSYARGQPLFLDQNRVPLQLETARKWLDEANEIRNTLAHQQAFPRLSDNICDTYEQRLHLLLATLSRHRAP